MNRDDIITMAREAAAQHGHTFKVVPSPETVEFITAFYALAAEKEREACAALCEEREDYRGEHEAAIRARSAP